MIWAEFEAAAPEIAGPGKERLNRLRVALLGTLRQDGSPRISPVEPYFVQGHLLFGAMTWSLKARDLLSDMRCVLHSSVTAPDAAESELKLYGRARLVEDQTLRGSSRGTWWAARPAEDARVFSLDIEQAAFVAWDLDRGEVSIRRWSPKDGVSEIRRSYP
jgi:hypothetical protein